MNTLTCVYCGHAYPEGTPPHGAQVLTDHIKVCEKHPMRKLEGDRNKLRRALVGLVGVDGRLELEAMEMGLRGHPVPEADRECAINAIHALRDTLPEDRPSGEQVGPGAAGPYQGQRA